METVGDLIERNAAYYPQSQAFVLDDRHLTYSQYADRSRRLSTSLHALGLQRQDRVGILSTNSIEYFEVFGACELAGYIAALYNFRCAAQEVAYLLRDSAPKAVFFEHDQTALIESLRSQLEDVDHWVCIGGATPPWAIAYDELLVEVHHPDIPVRSRSKDIAYLFYTSGTTGVPKGVPWSHATALDVARNEGRTMGAGARLLQLSPAFHVGGKGFPLGALWMGATVVLDRAGLDAGRFLALIERESITHTFMVPTIMQAALDSAEKENYNVSSLRAVMAAATAIPVPLLRRAIARFGPVFYIAYGATEAGNIAALMPDELQPDGTPEEVKRLASVGHFHPEIEGAVLDHEGRVCKPGEIGEVCVKNCVFQGYWNNSIATIEASRDGWFHTGDLGYLDEEGYLFLVDRRKDMIISGGENIYSREVEEALHRHPAVVDAAMIGVSHEKWGEVVRAIVVLHPGMQATEEELITFCQTQIARYKCPKSIVFVPAMPRVGSGKIDKISLRKQHANP